MSRDLGLLRSQESDYRAAETHIDVDPVGREAQPAVDAGAVGAGVPAASPHSLEFFIFHLAPKIVPIQEASSGFAKPQPGDRLQGRHRIVNRIQSHEPVSFVRGQTKSDQNMVWG